VQFLLGQHNHPINRQARLIYSLPSERSRKRYIRRFFRYGHILPFRRNGVFPTAMAAEIIAYLWNVHGGFLPEPRFYHPSQITRAEQAIGLTRKRNATTARQAFHPRNLTRRLVYWEKDYPYGVNNIRVEDMIDTDEAVVNLITANRNYGKSFSCQRARHEGPFQREGSTRLILAISADPNNGRRWVEISHGRSGTTNTDFYDFIRRIIIDLGPGTPNRRFCFILDNLVVHTNPMLLLMILVAGHRFVFRAPYWPKDAPIEYVFNVLENALNIRMHEIFVDADLRRVLQDTLRNIPTFTPWFHHVGYF
jgi:hypothetical protein